MSIKLRFILTLGFLLLGLTATLAWVRILERARQRSAAESVRSENQGLLNYWLNADASRFIRVARNLAADKKIACAFTTEPPAALPPDSSGDRPSGDFSVWLLHKDGTLFFRNPPDWVAADALPLHQAGFTRQVLQPSGCHFYVTAAEALIEVCAEPVNPTADAAPAGWLLLMRRWDQSLLDTLGSLAGGRLSLTLRPNPSGPPVSSSLEHNLLGWDHQPVAQLAADFPLIDPPSAGIGLLSPLPWFVVFGLLVMTTVALGLHRWVLHPLHRISASLAASDPAPLAPLRNTPGELGRVARLVESFFAQRDALKQSETRLQQALDERIRLGRDLHDGVIQALYATGMGLAGLKARLEPDQTDLASGLDLSRNALNETILDLRNFITGLEPEALKEQTFGEAVGLLLEHARNLRPVKTSCDIDENLAARLSLTQRANILQITREAISNALRHGEASEIAIRLHAHGALAEFEIRDNGHGFDPVAENGNGGHGLENLAGRARDIDAQYTLESHPGAGTRLRLTFTPRPRNQP